MNALWTSTVISNALSALTLFDLVVGCVFASESVPNFSLGTCIFAFISGKLFGGIFFYMYEESKLFGTTKESNALLERNTKQIGLVQMVQCHMDTIKMSDSSTIRYLFSLRD